MLEKEKLRPSANLLENDSLLVATTWNSLKPTLYKGKRDTIYYDSSSILACSISESVDPDYLILELRKNYIAMQLAKYRTGSHVSRISHKDFLQIEIDLPPIEEQIKRKYKYHEAIIQKQQAKVKELMKEYGVDIADQNSFLRHQISGTVTNAIGAFSYLKQIIESIAAKTHPEILNVKYNSKLEETLSDYLVIIERDLLSINEEVKKAGASIETINSKFEKIDLLKFIKNYAKELRIRHNNLFTVEINLDEDAMKEYGIKELFIQGDKKLLTKMLDNLVENAIKHAFSPDIDADNRIRFDFFYSQEFSNVQLDVCNTGNSLPDGMTYEQYTRKGGKLGINSGDGLGGWYVLQIMQLHNGELSFTDETQIYGIQGDFTTSIELTFPIYEIHHGKL